MNDFNFKNENNWKGYNTWCISFCSSLCIFGLTLDENETFKMKFQLKRAKYFGRSQNTRKIGMYNNKSDEKFPEGKRFYLDYPSF